MFGPQVPENGNTRETVNQWQGYNHNYNLTDGQFFEMKNMSSDCYPYLTQRGKRQTVNIIPQNARALIQMAEGFAYLDGLYLKYRINGEDKEIWLGEYFVNGWDDNGIIFDDSSKQSLIKMGGLLILNPVGLSVNIATGEVKNLSAKLTVGEEWNPDAEINEAIGYVNCDRNGNEIPMDAHYMVSKNEPTKKEDGSALQEGDYWYDTRNNALMVYDKDSTTWMPVTDTYIKIGLYSVRVKEPEYDPSLPDAPAIREFEYNLMTGNFDWYFKEGDAIYMDSDLQDINNGSIIQKVDPYGIVVIGLIPGGRNMYMHGRTLTIERKIPEMDFVISSCNRLWGCRYGYGPDGKLLNEIYATKLGDPTNWFAYEGLSTDSYAVSIGEDGPFTGAVEFQGMPTFFKENMIYRIYGNFPANYQLITQNARGVQKGSDKSIAICNEYLIYKSPADVVIYDGNKPTGISIPLGRGELFYNGIAGWCAGKYYIRMDKKYVIDGEVIYDPALYVYDMDYNVWYKEDSIDIERFMYNGNGKMYGYLNNGKMLAFGPQDPEEMVEEEDDVEFFAETGDMGYEYPDHKYLDRLTVRAFVDYGSILTIEISYDGGPWEKIGDMIGSDDTKSNTFVFRPVRCDHFKLRFSGHGNVRIYTLSRTMDAESEEHAWTL